MNLLFTIDSDRDGQALSDDTWDMSGTELLSDNCLDPFDKAIGKRAIPSHLYKKDNNFIHVSLSSSANAPAHKCESVLPFQDNHSSDAIYR